MGNGDQDGCQIIFNEDLIQLGIAASSNEEAMIQLSQNFVKNHYVKKTYPEALVSREREFPTGLLTKSIGVAIPHTDSKHVNKGSLGIGTLKHPVMFKTMDTGSPVRVSVLFMLAITHPSAQLKMLQKVIEVIRDERALLNIIQSKSKKEVIRIVQPFLVNLGS